LIPDHMKDAPAFDFYPERWLTGTAGLSDIEQIAYLRLLCHQWLMQGLPEDVKALKRLAGRGVTPAVLEKFPQGEDGRRRNGRLETIRVEQRERIAKRRAGAAKTNAKRWGERVASDVASDHDSESQATPERHRGRVATTHHPPQIGERETRGGAPGGDGEAGIGLGGGFLGRCGAIVRSYPANGPDIPAVEALRRALDAGADLTTIERAVAAHAARWRALAPARRRFCPGKFAYFSDHRWNDSPDEHPWVDAAETPVIAPAAGPVSRDWNADWPPADATEGAA
jgi:uncharacterized protein YdaU (DUF1376 family)